MKLNVVLKNIPFFRKIEIPKAFLITKNSKLKKFKFLIVQSI